jgi:hypothetical protein
LGYGYRLTQPTKLMKTFILGALSLPFEAHLDLSQSYEEELDKRLVRHADGSARQQINWRGKIKTRLTGAGWVPPGFDALDYDAPLEMSCIAAKTVVSQDRVIEIPEARRSDAGFEPFAIANVDGGRVEATIASTAGNVITIAPVANAQFYGVFYYPKINVFASLPTQRHDAINDKYRWELEAREV